MNAINGKKCHFHARIDEIFAVSEIYYIKQPSCNNLWLLRHLPNILSTSVLFHTH